MTEWVKFSEIKNQVSLQQLLHQYGVERLRRSGPEQLRGRCPIHGGPGTEAFHANLARNIFHCFACGAGGNVLDFVAAMERCSVREAALRLQQNCLGSVPQALAFRVKEAKLVTKKREVNPPLSFSLTLDSAHPYLAQRGIDRGTSRHFGVGFFARGGLMQGRMAIPIHDEQGRLIAYCGRALDQRAPRYRFPAGFEKSRVLFNYHRALATDRDEAIVVEGFFDCLRVHQAGFPGVMALMGALLSPAQKELLLRHFSRVILMLDGDETGRAAMRRIAADLSPACVVTEVPLESGMQPDLMSADQIRQILAAAERRQTSFPN